MKVTGKEVMGMRSRKIQRRIKWDCSNAGLQAKMLHVNFGIDLWIIHQHVESKWLPPPYFRRFRNCRIWFQLNTQHDSDWFMYSAVKLCICPVSDFFWEHHTKRSNVVVAVWWSGAALKLHYMDFLLLRKSWVASNSQPKAQAHLGNAAGQ